MDDVTDAERGAGDSHSFIVARRSVVGERKCIVNA